MQIFHVICFEWYCASEKGEKNNTCTPHIRLKPFVSLIPDNFGGNIGGSTTLLIHHLALFHSFWDSKISNFDHTFTVEQNIVQLDVSMQNWLRMNVAQAFNNLLEKNFSKIFIALFALPHKVKQISASTQLHDKHNMSASLESLIEFDNRSMA